MARVALTDDSGKWFDDEKAEKFEESMRWDGNNNISRATGDQWEHEDLYRTKGGVWILNHWSQHQGTGESYKEIGNTQAAAWLVQNRFDPHPDCEKEFAALEIA